MSSHGVGLGADAHVAPATDHVAPLSSVYSIRCCWVPGGAKSLLYDQRNSITSPTHSAEKL
jgi:hypothetical protein